MELTRRLLPDVATGRRWPIRLDHCFQRVFLDHAFGGRWTDAHSARPAYLTVSADRLRAAVDLAEQVLAGTADLSALNARSLAWRGKD
ncbi:hypothetical protein GGR88_000828 [Sphingomonas jejuensis]|uniref:GCN5-related N-acetyltransferase n=1 Tax=Sphingomonas jejuensis TaxID=904715 RepID=A0ABX0XKI2_9SPHN|nr:GCN5-related N-acetyltransferase [Sphingomonas jejuensis]NJC33354.1 hypothetical protein [Sphingomonas jejuensis]